MSGHYLRSVGRGLSVPFCADRVRSFGEIYALLVPVAGVTFAQSGVSPRFKAQQSTGGAALGHHSSAVR